MASESKFSPESRQALIGKKIIEVGNDWIQFDTGWKMYLGDDEINFLNDSTEPCEESQKEPN